MTHTMASRDSARRLDLPAASLRLLREIARHDAGVGVVFDFAPAGRWQLSGTNYRVNDRTFHPLDSHDLINIGDGRTDPVRITPAGRAYLTNLASTPEVAA